MGKSVCPALVCLICCQSVTLSAQHCTSFIHCTVYPVSTVFLALSALVCPSLGSGHFSVQVCHLASPLPSLFTLTISGLFQLFLQSWPSSGPSGAGRALLPLTAPPPVESKNFRSTDFSLVPLAQGYRCLVAVFSAFWQGHSSAFGPQSKSILPKNPLWGAKS